MLTTGCVALQHSPSGLFARCVPWSGFYRKELYQTTAFAFPPLTSPAAERSPAACPGPLTHRCGRPKGLRCLTLARIDPGGWLGGWPHG